MTMLTGVLLFVASMWAGAQNALAGGGSFVTFPALVLAGLDVRAANITSTVALFPSQAVSGFQTRALAEAPAGVGLRRLVGASLVGGAVGGLLLLATPAGSFARLVPFLVLFATGVFAWGSFGRRAGPSGRGVRLGPGATLGIQALTSVYGGYFGGGIGFLMVAALTVAGAGVRGASAAKNILAAVINAGAVALFVFSADMHWAAAAIVCAGSTAGAFGGAWMLSRVPERVLRGLVIVLGLALTVGLFLREG